MMRIDHELCLEAVQATTPKKSLISEILDVQQYIYHDEKSREWVATLECLEITQSTQSTKVFRRTARRGSVRDPARATQYLAVSYPWEHSEHENPQYGSYQIEDPQNGIETPCKVRDVVFRRAINFATHRGIGLFWIDGECIKDDEKEIAIQSMDLVYKHGKYSIGLLSTPIRTLAELNILMNLLQGQLTPFDSSSIKSDLHQDEILEILDLLHRLTTDPWWERAWIFQEDYKAGEKMWLSVPHQISYRKLDTLGTVSAIDLSMPGEMYFKSTQFRQMTTTFCLRVLESAIISSEATILKCKQILQKAAKYNISHTIGGGRIRQPMAPVIFSDILRRKITEHSDVLAIAANCCTYDLRLDTNMLRAFNHSLSVSVLALYLLNGEIMVNDPVETSQGTSSSDQGLSITLSDYLQLFSLKNIDVPVEKHGLRFLKMVRFPNVTLTEAGVQTSGWIWRAYKTIDCSQVASSLRSNPLQGHDDYGRTQSQELSWLIDHLEQLKHRDLAHELRQFEDMLRLPSYRRTPAAGYMQIMGEKLEHAIRAGKKLQLACLPQSNPYRAIFIAEDEETQPNLIFTSWSGGKGRGSGVLDKFVSLEVELESGSVSWEKNQPVLKSGVLPHLRTKRCVNGLYFATGTSMVDAVFPWPQGFV